MYKCMINFYVYFFFIVAPTGDVFAEMTSLALKKILLTTSKNSEYKHSKSKSFKKKLSDKAISLKSDCNNNRNSLTNCKERSKSQDINNSDNGNYFIVKGNLEVFKKYIPNTLKLYQCYSNRKHLNNINRNISKTSFNTSPKTLIIERKRHQPQKYKYKKQLTPSIITTKLVKENS